MGEYYRSKSYTDGRNEMDHYYIENGGATNNNGYNNFQDLRCHSALYSYPYATSTTQQQVASTQFPKELKKGKSANATSSYKAGWCFSDPEIQRKKRVVSYKSYGVEGKIKRSFSKSFRWLKGRYSHMVHGW